MTCPRKVSFSAILIVTLWAFGACNKESRNQPGPSPSTAQTTASPKPVQSAVAASSIPASASGGTLSLAFGNTDPERKMLVVLVPSNGAAPSAQSFDRAVCNHAQVVAIKPMEAQPSPEKKSSGSGAPTFAPVEDKTSGECLLANHEYLSAWRPVDVQIDEVVGHSDPCGPDVMSKVPLLEQRPLSACSLMGTFSGGTIVAAEYQPKGESLLAAFVLITPSAVFTRPLPASSSNNDAWRADDEGKLNAEYIKPMFALVSENAIEVAINWSGAEGDYLALYRSSPNGTLDEVVNGSVYTSH